MSARERELSLRGTRVHVREVGHGPPVLLINGLGAHTGMLRPIERALPGRHVISFDAPGIGRSPAVLVPPTVPGLARLATELLDALGLERVDVVGYSFGGAVAQQLARRAPDRIERLVLAASSPGWGGVPGNFAALVLVSTPLRYYSRWYYARTIGLIAGGRARDDEEFVARHGEARLGDPPSPKAYYGQLMVGSAWSSLPWLHDLSVPTLVVGGRDDPLTPAVNGVIMAARIGGARLVLVDDGHLLLLDERSAALEAIAEFLDGGDVGAEVGETELRRALADASSGPPPWSIVSRLVRWASGVPARA